MSRRFAEVGVRIPASRLQELAAGEAATDGERIDVTFALAACEIERENLSTRMTRARRRCGRWLLVAAMAVVALMGLVSVAYLVLSMASHLPPF
jgi:hypothetical protein